MAIQQIAQTVAGSCAEPIDTHPPQVHAHDHYMERECDEPGTYRGSGGGLVHVRRRADGCLVVEHEAPTRGGQVPVILMKLSDDPNWPDLDLAAPLGAAFFD